VQDLSDWMRRRTHLLREHLCIVVVASDAAGYTLPGADLLEDRTGAFAGAYGARAMSYLVRPDGHLGWRGRSWREPGLRRTSGGCSRPPERPVVDIG